MANHRKSAPHYGRNGTPRRVTLTSGVSLTRGQKPSPADVRSALSCLYKTAAHMERDENYADHITRECLSHGYRLDLLRAVVVLICKNASADTIWEIVEYFLSPAFRGLCEGQHETDNVIGTGLAGSDGRDHLCDLERDEGEPLCRIIDAIARHCPQILYGHPESSND